ncbi:MAG: glycosyltransferase, partial [Verrucomicrobiota bacterium]
MLYSIIIPAYDEVKELPATLAAIKTAMQAVPLGPGEIIVVDNNSSDPTAAVAKAEGADQVVFEPINQIARARNTGASAASGRYLIFVDADTRISASLLQQALSLLEAGTHVGGGSVVRFEGNINAIGRFGIGLWERISKLTQTAAGSFIFTLREAFEAVGGFDERLYASEEVRMTNRLKKWGRKQKLRFKIIEDAPALTSARKLEWYSSTQIIGYILLAPLSIYSRRLCAFWYKRP